MLDPGPLPSSCSSVEVGSQNQNFQPTRRLLANFLLTCQGYQPASIHGLWYSMGERKDLNHNWQSILFQNTHFSWVESQLDNGKGDSWLVVMSSDLLNVCREHGESEKRKEQTWQAVLLTQHTGIGSWNECYSLSHSFIRSCIYYFIHHATL